MFRPIRYQGVHLGFPIGPTNTNFVEDVGILLSVRYRCILFSGCKKSRKCLIDQDGPTSWFSNRPKNTNLVGDFEFLFPVKFCSAVSENKSKMYQPIRY